MPKSWQREGSETNLIKSKSSPWQLLCAVCIRRTWYEYEQLSVAFSDEVLTFIFINEHDGVAGRSQLEQRKCNVWIILLFCFACSEFSYSASFFFSLEKDKYAENFHTILCLLLFSFINIPNLKKMFLKFWE